MAGHSKWANIKHRKSRQDAKRGKEFTKAIREITAAAKTSGEDSPRLRQAIEQALSINMTRVSIDKAVKRATGSEEGEDYQEVIYEGYGPKGSAVYLECLTDNKNRSVAEIRHTLTRCGGNLGASGCAAHLFDKVGMVEVKGIKDEDKLFMDAVDAGATELENAGDDTDGEDGSSIYYLQSSPSDLQNLRAALEKKDYEIGSSQVTMLAHTNVELTEDGLEKMQKLIDALEDLDDVQNVYCNVALES
ncbi:MAG: YebC/PmpR family DNA-binding transcriptional regulator [Candidatus Portiera sp.]|nr:YebC/PmpR family DNA-binding transcriptional regulator [Portiera sp.]